jgi:outer membrane protein insertion porin family
LVRFAGRRRLALLVLLAGVLALAGRAGAQPPPIQIRELVVEGNRRVQEAVILGRVKAAIGDAFSPAQLSEDLRAIFALGFFDDVRMRVEDFEGGVKVTFVVIERPFVRDVSFVGNVAVATADLLEKITLRLGSVYNPVDVQRAVEALTSHYEDEGYFEVQITPEVEHFADGDVRVVFSVAEGRRMTIDRIVIEGNQGLTDRQIKGALATRERQYFVLRGTVQRERLDEDVERILALYNDNGYIQARVESHDVSVDRERARVTVRFTVVEGPQYRVGAVTFSGVTLLPESELRRQLQFKEGDVFSRTSLREGVRAIADLYGTIGRASADVVPRTSTEGNRLHVLLEVTEGPEVYIERINISGNTRSEEKILRREIPMVEGDRFTLRKLQTTRQRLINLGYFETVNVSTQPGSDLSRIIVNVDVTERPTGLFSIGGGFSSVDSFIGTVDLSQNNFLGRGWQATLRLRLGTRSQLGVLSFTEPWLFDRPLSAGFDIYSLRRDFAEYDYETTGLGLRLSHPFAEYWRWHLGYRISADRISDLAASATPALREEAGRRLTSLVSGGLTRDSRDNVLTPTRGGQTSIGVDAAGLGGDTRFVKSIAFTTYFRPIWLGHIISGRLEGGYGFGWGGEELPLFERFYLGGPNSVRSFRNRRLSPVDEAGNRVGGSSEILANVEYIVPLPFNMRAAAFFDIGNAYGFGTPFDITDTREAAGLGLRWMSPFGPIRLDYGVNLDRREGEGFGAFHFSVGSPF